LQLGGSERRFLKSITNDLGVIGRRARDLDLPWLKQSKELKLKDLIAAMKYEYTSGVERKRPLQLKHLLPSIARWDRSDPFVLQEAVILLMGHDCLLRVGELLGGLTTKDVVWKKGCSEYSVWLRRSKCNLSGDGEWVTCRGYSVVSSGTLLRRHMEEMGLLREPDALLFPTRRGRQWCKSSTISASWLRNAIKAMAESVGLD
jgi:hypothetical protein